MKLTYWLARGKDAPRADWIRTKTKKEAKEARDTAGAALFDEVEKIEIEYKDGFDLLQKALGGTGGIV